MSPSRSETLSVKSALPSLPSSGGAARLSVTSESLLQGRREILIEHGAALYRLSVTAAGKLILTK